jgi:hypothetical protein
MNKKIIIFLVCAVILFIGSEIYLRYEWGFCDTVLIRADENFEYIAQPDQNRRRFKRHIRYNSYSMRNEPLTEKDTCLILGFGDSVLNGGVLTDQDSTAAYIINKKLTNINNGGGISS